ncbi:unnamed protein product [Larinioides sclopetarius]|uniref:Uncharacterized protein n=1 Tax=Larinioides sclopetarius TaxID=280406 RepID=A0AAV2AYP9_9ARAC
MQRSTMLLRIFLCLTFVVALSNVQGRPASEDSENDGYYDIVYYYTMDSMEESGSNYEMSEDSSFSYSSSGSSWREGQSDDEFSQRGGKGQNSQTKEMSYGSEGGSKGGGEGKDKQKRSNEVDNSSSGSKSPKEDDISRRKSHSDAGGYEETFYSSQESMSEAEYNTESKSGSHRRRSNSMSRAWDENGNNNGESQSTDVTKRGNKNENNKNARSGSETSKTSEEESNFESASSNQRNKQTSRKSTDMTRRGMNGKENYSDDDKSGNKAEKKEVKGDNKKDREGLENGDKSPKEKKTESLKENPQPENDKSPNRHGKSEKNYRTGGSYSEYTSKEDDTYDSSERRQRSNRHYHKSTDRSKGNGDDQDHKTKTNQKNNNRTDDDDENGNEKSAKTSKNENSPHELGKKSRNSKDDDNIAGKKPGHQKDDDKNTGKKPGHPKDEDKEKQKHGKPSKDSNASNEDDDSKTKPKGKKPNNDGKKPQGPNGKPKSDGKQPSDKTGEKKIPHKPGGRDTKNSSEQDDTSQSSEKSGHGGKPGEKKPEHKPGHKKPSDDDENKDGKKPKNPSGDDKSPHGPGNKPGHPKDDDKKPGNKPDHPKNGDKKKPKHGKPGKDSNTSDENDDSKGKPKGKKPNHDGKRLQDPNGKPKPGGKNPSDKTGEKKKPHKPGGTDIEHSSEEDDSSESSESNRRHKHHHHESSEKSGYGGKPGDKKPKHKPGHKKPLDDDDDNDDNEIGKKGRKTSHDDKMPDDKTPGRIPSHSKDGHKKKPNFGQSGKDSDESDEDDDSTGKPRSKDKNDKPKSGGKRRHGSKDKPKRGNNKASHKSDTKKPQEHGGTDTEYSSEEDDSFESSETRNRHKNHQHKLLSKSGRGKNPEYSKQKPEDENPSNKNGDNENNKPKNNGKMPSKGNKRHSPHHFDEDDDSNYNSDEDDSSENSVRSHKDRRHRHKSNIQKGKHGDKYSKHKHETRKPSDDVHQDSKHDKIPRQKHEHPKNKKNLHAKDDNDSDESDEEHKGRNGKDLKHRKDHKKPGKVKKTPEKDKNKLRPSQHGKKPKEHHRHSKKTDGNSYQSSEEFDLSDESENNIRRKRHEHRSFDRQGNKDDKKHYGHHKHEDFSKNGRRQDDNKKKPKHHHDHQGKKRKWDKKEDGSDSDKVDEKESKHPGHHESYKGDKTGRKHQEPEGHKKKSDKINPSKSDDKKERNSRHGRNRGNDSNDDIDFESNYKEIHNFFKDLTFEKFQRNKKIQKNFYKYFRFNAKSKSVFSFMKLCFQSSKVPTGFGKHFDPIFKRILQKKPAEIPDDYYKQFIIKVFGSNKHDFGKRYKRIYKFLKHLKYEDVQTEDNMEKFYKYFKFYPENENVFKFIKHCFRNSKKPVDFNKKFSPILNIILQTDLSPVLDKYYPIFVNILFGKNQDHNPDENGGDDDSNSNNDDDIDFESNYKELHNFFKDLTFEKFQRNKKIQKNFYKYFRFNAKSKSVFSFMKLCFQSSKVPTGFGKHFAPIFKRILQKKPAEIPDDYYKQFIIKVFGSNKHDFGKRYKRIYKFLKHLKYEDVQTEDNMEKFYKYFKFYPENENVFKFIKHCFRNSKKPVDFNKKFSPILNIILQTDLSPVLDKYYPIFVNILFGKNQDHNPDENGGDDDSNSNNDDDIDFESNYKEIHNFFKDLTFEKFQRSKKIQKNFYKYFRFNAKSKSVFSFMKLCFQSSKVPTGFGKHFAPIFKRILQKKPAEIPDDYYKQFIIKVFGSNKHNFGKRYKRIYKFLKHLKYEDVQTEDNMEKFYKYFKFYPENENVFKFIKHCFRNSKKPVDFDKKFSPILNIILKIDFSPVLDKYYTIFTNLIFGRNSNNKGDIKDDGNDSNKDMNENTGDVDYNTNYPKIFDFFSSISFEDLQNKEKMQKFYHFFHFECKSESVFDFLKFCFQSSEKPSNFGILFTPILNVILNFNLEEIPDIYYTMVTNNFSINNKGYKSDFGEDYDKIYNFLINLSYAELQTKENWEKFFTIFGFYPVSESMWDYIKYCFQYSEKPANLETNFHRCINAIFKSNFEITIKFYIDFAKYLFGESQLNYRDNYDAVYKFMKDLSFEDAQDGDNWDTFYYYFQCYPASESMFKIFKYCYQHEQKPANFDANFLSVLKAVFNATSEDVFDNLYNIFDKNLFGDDNNNNQQDFGANYDSIYKFLKKLNFDDAQTNENRQKFFSFFHFYPESESEVEYMKYCFQYADKPALFEVNFEKAYNSVLSLGSGEVPTHLYTQFAKNLFGGKNQFYKGKYDEVHKFMEGLKYEDMETPENWDLFYYYFECYPVSESLFDFIKFCFRNDEAPVNFYTNFDNCLKLIFDSDVDDVSDDLYLTFIKNLFNGNIYKAIYYFLKNLTFEEVKKPYFREIFYYYFKFYPKNPSLFDYIKFCFQHAEKPVNFEKNFQATLGSYLDSGDEQVSDDLREKFMYNLFGDKSDGQSEWYDFGFNQMLDEGDEQNDSEGSNYGDSGDNNYGDSGDNNGYSWNNGNVGENSNENQDGNSNSGNDQNYYQYYEWYY